jgi:hypothetical protein
LRLAETGRLTLLAIKNRLVDIYVAVSDLQIEPTGRIRADPRLVMDGRSLAPEVR